MVIRPFLFIFDQFSPMLKVISLQKMLGARLFKHERLFSTLRYTGFRQKNMLGTEAQKGPLSLSDFNHVVSEIWPNKVKSCGHVYSSRHIYWAKYGISVDTARLSWQKSDIMSSDDCFTNPYLKCITDWQKFL